MDEETAELETLDDADDTELEGSEDQQDDAQGESDDFSIEIEGEAAEEEPPLVKTLRQEIRDRDRELGEYRKASLPKIEVGEKPTLEGCDWDEEKYSDELLGWTERKRQADNQEVEAQQQVEVRNQQVQRRFTEYRAAAARLPVKDFEEAEKAVIAILPDGPERPFQQALLTYSKDPAKLVYALGKHPAKLEALARESDPIRFILAINDMERNLKVTTRKKPPAPEAETIQRGSAPIAATKDKKGDELLAKAANGDPRAMQEYYRHAKAKKAA